MTLAHKTSAAETHFDINQEFSKHGWKGQMTLAETEKALEGRPAFTYLTRFGEMKGKFTLSFVHPDGYIKHDIFVLVDWTLGVFANGQPCHRGPLDVLVLLKMDCTAGQARPL